MPVRLSWVISSGLCADLARSELGCPQGGSGLPGVVWWHAEYSASELRPATMRAVPTATPPKCTARSAMSSSSSTSLLQRQCHGGADRSGGRMMPSQGGRSHSLRLVLRAASGARLCCGSRKRSGKRDQRGIMKVLMPGQKPPRDLHDTLAEPGERLQGRHLVGVSRTESDAYTNWLCKWGLAG